MNAAELDQLLTEVRRAGERGALVEAEAYARRALAIARAQDNERAEARTLFVCGQIELHRWASGVPGPERFANALDALERAADIYSRLDSIDLLPVLISLAEAILAIDDAPSAKLLYQRVLIEARKAAWQQHGAEHADGLCARACFGLAECALVERRHDDARSHLERALALTTRYALDATRRDVLASIADAFERGLGDELQARRLRKMLRF
jgi:tetratricopeptide (TPR) repeat protein